VAVMDLTPQSVTAFVHGAVPAIARIGVVVESISPGRVDLRVPIAGNSNHVGTMYAGALFALAELPGGLLPLSVLDPSRFTPIVADLTIRYLAAARTDVTLTARMDPDELVRLGRCAEEDGRAEYILELEGSDTSGRTVIRSTARYVLRRG